MSKRSALGIGLLLFSLLFLNNWVLGRFAPDGEISGLPLTLNIAGSTRIRVG